LADRLLFALPSFTPRAFLRFDPAGIGLAMGRQRSTIRRGQDAGLKNRRGQPPPLLLRHMIEMGRAGGRAESGVCASVLGLGLGLRPAIMALSGQ